ncbi:hypothetical protein Sgly_0111 [Syntrophobotulus glycolicus DSM 8271]|uniref:Uncharacterized protein n=1 Tax=Syntrophobotulus glycolicus (strain DSM 8271 / FlGlyR) TaxID=645991 RepID=F0SVK6_SYNGF|nr:hypothetical protein [Syntrophobotulus glycolicus]ADY54482.1 hypothetical protein Sgly_0111 [Syntrophobotulus glycolicus DSM 8271]
MKHKNRILMLTIIVTLLVCAAGGILTRSSYVNNVDVQGIPDKVSGYEIALEEESWLSKIYFDHHIQSFSELKDKSDIIVKVKPTEERKVLNQSLFSQVQILEIYKGSDLKTDENIYIYEPASLGNDQIYMPDGYIMQLDDQEYIFFLKRLKAPEGYQYKGKEKISYMPVSTTFGKYSVKETNTSVIPSEEIKKGLHFSEIKHMDIITTNAQTLERYLKIKSNVGKMVQE